MEEYTLQIVSSKLRAVIVCDSQVLMEIYNQIKDIINESKSWRVEGGETALEKNQDKTTLLERRLSQTCAETGDIKNMRWLYQQIHKDVGFYCINNTSSSSHDPYIGTVKDLMAQYDKNCRKKEEIENMLNQVHKKINKYKTKQFCSESGKDISTSVENMDASCMTTGSAVRLLENVHIESHGNFQVENVHVETRENVHVENMENANVENRGNVDVENRENVYMACEESVHVESQESCHVESQGKENVSVEKIENQFQRSATVKRQPLLPLQLSQCKGDNSCDKLKKDPLTRVRSPVLCAYLQKRKDSL